MDFESLSIPGLPVEEITLCSCLPGVPSAEHDRTDHECLSLLLQPGMVVSLEAINDASMRSGVFSVAPVVLDDPEVTHELWRLNHSFVTIYLLGVEFSEDVTSVGDVRPISNFEIHERAGCVLVFDGHPDSFVEEYADEVTVGELGKLAVTQIRQKAESHGMTVLICSMKRLATLFCGFRWEMASEMPLEKFVSDTTTYDQLLEWMARIFTFCAVMSTLNMQFSDDTVSPVNGALYETMLCRWNKPMNIFAAHLKETECLSPAIEWQEPQASNSSNGIEISEYSIFRRIPSWVHQEMLRGIVNRGSSPVHVDDETHPVDGALPNFSVVSLSERFMSGFPSDERHF
ncbi:unnamed protein product [Notodromas monacha]|uniref:Uncharacterized protein n=1 Tax=Notodromas monacha TaxID=399045 RepID=A0A7R9GBK7_9CRUS|nr:unnamed protein product [Notodromas monacha]CAG0915158.1 unnamed protein product [Notodromas monacha]